MRLRVIGFVVSAAVVAALSVAPGAVAATRIGPLVLSGPKTIQTEGANIVSFEFRGGPQSKWDAATAKGDMPHAAGVTELVVTKPIDASSPALTKAVALGTQISQAFLVWGDGATQQSLCLQDVVVSSVQAGSSSGGAIPVETVFLTYVRLGLDPQGTDACNKLGPAPPATVTTAVKGGTLYARVACLSARCDGTLSLRVPKSACARLAGTIPTEKACAGRSFRLGRVALGNGRVRVLRLAIPPGRLRRGLARLSAGASGGIVAVLRHGTGRPITLKAIPSGARPRLPKGVPAVQATPVTPAPAPGTSPLPPAPQGPVATSLAITTCGPVGQFPRQFAGQVTPVVPGLSITMTYTPPPPGAVISQTVTTNAAGQFSDAVAASTPGTWSAAAGFAGNAAYGASTSPSCDFMGG